MLVSEAGIQDNAYTISQRTFGNYTAMGEITVKFRLVLYKSQHSDMIHVVDKSKFSFMDKTQVLSY